MPKNSKPRKAYRPRPVVHPLNARDSWKIEGDTHAALLAMEAGTVEEAHLAMLAAHADMVRRLFDPSRPERRQADTIIRNGQVVNVYSGKIASGPCLANSSLS